MLAARATRIKPSPTIAVSTKAQELQAAGRDIINLGSGEPDFDTPEHIKEAANAAIAAGETNYTAVPGTPALRKAAADKLARENNLEYSPAQICASVGAKHAIFNLMQAVVDDGDEVVILAPYWVSYPDMSLLCGGKPVIAAAGADQHFKVTAEQLRGVMSDKTKLVLINSPCNPSGAVYDKEELTALGEVLAEFPRAIICTDDIYEHIIYDGAKFCNILHARPDLKARVVVVNGVSKAYAMTGWRIGYAAGEASLIKAMTKIQSQATSNPCSIAQAAAAAALNGGVECLAPMLAAFDRRRQMVRAALNEIDGINVPPIAGAFYAFADAGEVITRLHGGGKLKAADDVALCEFLLEEAGVAAVPGSAFGAPACFRISFAAADDLLEDAVKRIAKALS